MSDHLGTPKTSLSFTVETVPGRLSVVGVTDEGLGNTTWVASPDGVVIVVDPERDAEPYLAAVEKLTDDSGRGLLVAETHLHADFVSGARALADDGATAIVPAAARAQWPHCSVVEGERLDFGRWQLEVLATPGHTPEHVAYLLRELGRPTAVFTGGSLLVGAVARTDLIDPADTDGLTRALWRSINRELMSLPDDVVVLPTHGAGSFCSAVNGSRRWTSIGVERRANPLLGADEDAFVRAVLDSLGTYPPYFLRLREVNRLGPHLHGAFPLLEELTVERVVELRDHGATIVDVRSVADYAAAHIPGSLANALRPQFSSWLGWLVPEHTAPLVFVIDDRADRRELVRQCLNVGYENLAGTITIPAWHTGGGALGRTTLVAPDEMGGCRVVDVRQASEFASGHIPGAAHVELGRLSHGDAELGPGPLVTMCGHGERAATAASLLERDGHAEVAIAVGGPADWAARTDQPLEQ